jgi:hypothetical protein
MTRYSSMLILSALVVMLTGCPEGGPSTGIFSDGIMPTDSHTELPFQEDTVVIPEGCQDDFECPDGVCNPFTHTCVECMIDADCPDKHECDKWHCIALPECIEDGDCPEGLLCWAEEEVCVECVEDTDCPLGECLDNECVLPCGDGCPPDFICDELTNLCVECLSDVDCLEEEWCYNLENECLEDQCFPGAVGCVGNSTAVCADNGSGWTDLQPCPSGLVCKSGECEDLQICEPGLVSCKDEFTIHICSADGTALEEEPCPDEFFCKDGQCIGDCVPNCDNQECGPSNCPGYSCGECDEGFHCSADLTCHPGICAEGQTMCVEPNAVVFCLGPQEGWSESKPCPEGTWCEDGKCMDGPTICDPGQTICEGQQTLWCNDEGTEWMKGKSCPPGTVCQDGECWEIEPTPCMDVLNCMMEFETNEPDPWMLDQCMGADGWIDQIAMELFFCVFDSCGEWSPGSGCFEKALYGDMCGWLYQECTGVCIPNCNGQECGADGCGGVCGFCPNDWQCQGGVCVPWGQMECADVIGCMMEMPCPADDPYECMMMCTEGQEPPELAVELFWCVTDFCGWWMPFDECFEFALKDGCGWLYEECVGGCQPNCWNKECGNNGCGGSCGYCPPGLSCNKGVCTPGGTGDCGEILDCLMNEPCPAPDPEFCLDMCIGPGQEAPELLYELFDCVEAMCGWWNPYDECFFFATQEMCADVFFACVGGCQPECQGKQCGDNGCGGSCGNCPSGLQCTPAGKCEQPCQPNCWTDSGQLKECGSNTCGGSCGVCPSGSSCSASGFCIQVCAPNCTGQECGSDGCGGSCGICESDEACKSGDCVASLTCAELTECIWDCPPWGGDDCQTECYLDASPAAKIQWAEVFECVGKICPEGSGDGCVQQALYGACSEQWNMCQDCTPECVGKQCGANGCGGTCGECPPGFTCDNWGSCLCQPQCEGKECGNDGCGGSCGSCTSGDVCNANGFCVCNPKCENKQCGPNGCGGNCGTCPSGSQCTPGGKCKPGGPNQCGNGICQVPLGEDCNSCPQDCDCTGSCCDEHDFPGCDDPDVMMCVCEMDPYCCDAMWDGLCVEEAWQCGGCGGCQPACFNKECGPDNCGGSCGSCPFGSSCNSGGICEQTCKPDCEDKECGSDGCGGSCGLCGPEEACDDDWCTPSLGCGEMVECMWSCPPYDEDCHMECWEIASPDAKQQWWMLNGCIMEVCGEDAPDQCWNEAVDGPCKQEWYGCLECTPECVGKQCGPDGCGGSCGECPGGYVCDNFGTCLCQPDCEGKSCGNDSCGGSCGTCPTGHACNWQGNCVCMPQCQNKECGNDGCGGTCGQCPMGFVCNGKGMCKEQPNQCGNGFCQQQIGETCDSCPQDCGPCVVCGDGICDQDIGENCQSCPWDCGPCGGGDCCEAHDSPGCDDPDVMMCVCDMDPFCCQNNWDSICANEAQECGANCCEPNCWGKECGGDGCGGSCGQCSPWEQCKNGQCYGGPQVDCPEFVKCALFDCFAPDPEMCMEKCAQGGEIPGIGMEVVYCVWEVCNWQVDPGCAEWALYTECSWAYQECTGGCEPMCWNADGTMKECGDDGCGGSCGVCPPNSQCTDTGQCVSVGSCGNGWCQQWQGETCDNCPEDCGPCPCEPQCVSSDGEMKECGPDGCGGVCGWCPDNAECVNGFCQTACEPSCTIFGFPKQCGTDGCGGSCGFCAADQKCDAITFQCVDSCTPKCAGKECGPDGCGGVCGSCAPGEQCTNNGQCAGQYSCSDMIECAIECGFALNCALDCMNNGSDQSQQLFQQLAYCVMQNCGFNVNPQCVIESFQGDCAKQYEVCLMD